LLPNAGAPGFEWAEYKEARELNMSERMIEGELSSYPNNGFVLTFDARETT